FYMRGGAERVMFNDLEALSARGVEVIPFSAADPANLPSDRAGEFAKGVDVHATSAKGRLRAAREAIHCARTAKSFARLLDKERPDVVHFHNIYGRLTTSILPVTRERGVPSVLTVHDYKVACPAYLMLRNGKPCMSCVDGRYFRCAVHRCHKGNLAASAVYAIEAWYARRSGSYDAVSAFLCPSRFIGNVLEQSGIDESRIVHHPNCVDPEAYKPSYQGEYALFTGRLSHEKGIATLIEALKGTGIPLRIAGTGPLLESLERQVMKNGLNHVTFEGHCAGERLAELYRGAAVVVVPSEWFENAPMVILEAFAYGKPVIAARIGGIPEMIEEGQTGRLFMPGHALELRYALGNLWNQPEELERMGRNARAAVETRFSETRRIASLMTIYERLRAAARPALIRPNPAHSSGLNVLAG
ncbi:MAG TPA: glycosyltransferase family 4 protein, partial [Bryobacteraceae bacterium]|nr:glycosyltransferase family 4 protein [Bryobacteraceae bacterium]